MQIAIALLALAVERAWGYPQRLLDSVGHPVVWFGKLIEHLEGKLNQPEKTAKQRKEAGVAALLVLLGAVLFASLVALEITRSIPHGWILEALLAAPFLAQKELGRAVRAVADGLDGSLAKGREAVSHIVGRDPAHLDDAGVSRAAIETLAENTSDGVIAPLFWLIVFGLPGIALYKAINTADSMIGHLNERYRDFGWASAKLDDAVNFIPARITAVLYVAACFWVHKASPSRAWQTAKRDARKHHSPNAGWPEAAMAGALDVSLGGPRAYEGEMVDLPSLGTGRRALGPGDIRRALELYSRVLNLALGLCLAGALAWAW